MTERRSERFEVWWFEREREFRRCEVEEEEDSLTAMNKGGTVAIFCEVVAICERIEDEIRKVTQFSILREPSGGKSLV